MKRLCQRSEAAATEKLPSRGTIDLFAEGNGRDARVAAVHSTSLRCDACDKKREAGTSTQQWKIRTLGWCHAKSMCGCFPFSQKVSQMLQMDSAFSTHSTNVRI